MAMNKQDYQYVSNSFDRLKNRVDDGELKIGSTVKNLVVELSQETVYNPDYPEFYGSKELNECWSSSSNYEVKKTFIKESGIFQGSYQENVTKVVSGVTNSKTGKFYYCENSYYIPTGSFNHEIKLNKPDELVGIFNVEIVSVNLDSNTLICRFESSTPHASLNATLTYKINKKIYSCVYEYIFRSEEFVSLDLTEGTYNYDHVNRKLTINFYSVVNDNSEKNFKTFVATLWSRVPSTTTDEGIKTIRDGFLKHQVLLKPNTSYVIQIIDSIIPNNKSLPRNKIYCDGFEKTFDQYLFFETPNFSNEKDFILDIYGISYGYKIYNKTTENGKTCFRQLRSFEGSKDAKVFLFESQNAWVVNKQGVITSLMDKSLECSQDASESSDYAYLSVNEIKNIFLQAPAIKVNNNTNISVELPGGKNIYNEWKYKSLWSFTVNSEKPEYENIKNIHLFVYRNFLTSETRRYSKKYKKTQYGKLKNIQGTKRSKVDNYTQEREFSDISLKDYILNDDNNEIKDVPFAWEKNAKEYIIKSAEKKDLSLAKLCLCGYNYTYGKGLNSDLRYKYTSISFAWGYYDPKTSIYVRLSDYSIPLILDRNAIQFEEFEDKYVLTSKDCVFIEKESTSYYPSKAVYLEIKE